MRWLVVLMFALLPLQWFVVAGTPLGQARLHQVAMLGLAMVIAVRLPLRNYVPVLRTGRVFIIANLYLVGVILAVATYRGDGVGSGARQLLYLLVFVALGGYFYRAAASRDQRVLGSLRLVAAVTGISVLLGFTIAMLVNGVNPAGVFARSIAAADPEIFQKEVFKSSFAGFGYDEESARGNLRHEIFGSVLLSMLVSTWAMRVGSAPTRGVLLGYRATMMLGVALLTLSLSRSILIAAAVWPLLAVWRSLRRGELSPRQVGVLFGSLALAGVVLASGLGTVLVNRFFTDTTGYAARAENYWGAFAAIPDHWVVGGFATAGESSHNFVIDTLLRDGIFAAIPAAVIVVTMLIVFGWMSLRLPRLPAALVPVVAALALPLVRASTSGGGLIPPVEWVALGLVVGVLAAWRTPAPDTVPARDDQARLGARV
ncbi:hypothetical protein BH20ACT6_BH20ACT6_07260 [soil metagenome]